MAVARGLVARRGDRGYRRHPVAGVKVAKTAITTWLASRFGAAGVYAVMASFVTQQTKEIGVRLALGATPLNLQHGVFVTAQRHLGVGLLIGLPIAWWLSRGFTALLFQVTPADVSVYIGVAALLIVVGLLAAWIPARRAARIDPIISLRA